MDRLSSSVIRQVAQELTSINRSPPEGIKLIINEHDMTDVQAWIEGPAGTPYEGGFFKVKLQLDSEFPASPPKGFFLTKVFHPNVSKTGEICVNTLKKDWKKELGINHILLTIKCLLIAPNPESALNEDAGRLLLEDYDAYASHAKLWTGIHAQAPIEFSVDRPDRDNAAVAAEQTVSLETSPKKKSGREGKKRSLKRL